MKADNSTVTGTRYHEIRCRVKRLFKQAKRGFEENNAVNSKSDPKTFFKNINNKKEIQGGIGPSTDNSGNIVTDYQ